MYEKTQNLVYLAPEQLQWQAQELGVLIHFNIATYIDGDGCTGQIVPNISLFQPYLLNTDNWVQTMVDFGAQYAVLVGKVSVFSFAFDQIYFFSLIIKACLRISYGTYRCEISSESLG